MDSDINREHGSKDSKVKGDERKWRLNDEPKCNDLFNMQKMFNIEFNQN